MENGRKTNSTAKEKKSVRMGAFTQEASKIARNVEMVFSLGATARILLVNFSRTIFMVSVRRRNLRLICKALTYETIIECTKGYGTTTKWKDKGNLSGQTEDSIKGSILMIRNMATEFSTDLMAGNMKENGKMASSMVKAAIGISKIN